MLLNLKKAAIAQLPEYIPTKGLIAYWSLNGHGNDAGPNNHHGKTYATETCNNRYNHKNAAMSFTAMESRVQIPHSIEILQGTNAFAFSFWTRAYESGSTDYTLICKQNGPGNGQAGLNIRLDTNQYINYAFKYYPNANGFYLNSAPVQLDKDSIYHIVASFENRIGRIFINGMLVAEKIDSNMAEIGINKYPLLFGIGNYDNNFIEPYYGALDNIGLWNRALTPEEVVKLYNEYGEKKIDEEKPEVDIVDSVYIFPNPASNFIHISNEARTSVQGFDLDMYNQLGQVILSKVHSEYGDLVLDLSNYAAGIYTLKLLNLKTEKTKNYRIVINSKF